MTMTGYTGMFYDYGKGYPFPEYDIEIIDNFTKVHRPPHVEIRHRRDRLQELHPAGRSGAFRLRSAIRWARLAFNGAWTGNKGWPNQPSSQGNAFADFLLGTAAIHATSPGR